MTRSNRRRLPLLALLACAPLLLSPTGEVGAEQAADAGAAQAGVCETPLDPGKAARERLARTARNPRDLAAARDVIVLNGQGYNYAAAPDRELERAQRERMRQQQDPAAPARP